MSDSPSAADRLRRTSPVEQPAAAPAQQVRVKPVRITVDLEPSRYDTVREFAFRNRMSHSDVVRNLIDLLEDPEIAAKIAETGHLPF